MNRDQILDEIASFCGEHCEEMEHLCAVLFSVGAHTGRRLIADATKVQSDATVELLQKAVKAGFDAGRCFVREGR